MPQTPHLVLVPTSAAGGEASTLAIAGESAHHAGVESGAIERIESANRIASMIGRFESFIFSLGLVGFVKRNPLPPFSFHLTSDNFFVLTASRISLANEINPLVRSPHLAVAPIFLF